MTLAQMPASTETPPGSAPYTTREQQLAQRHNTAVPYLRLGNDLCRAFLEAGVDPLDFEAVKLLFPFVGEAVLLEMPRRQQHLTDWLYFAFLAGNDLGARHPELLPDVLPDYAVRDSRRRLGILQRLSDQEAGTGRALHHAFARVVQEQYPDTPPEKLDGVYAELALRTMRSGFAAAALAHLDPPLCDFYGALPPDSRMQFRDPLWRHWLGAPADAVGRTLVDRLEHPVLRMVRELYPGRPTECAVVQGFLREHLGACGATSEKDCPVSDAELMDWLANGIHYGRRVQREQPETVQRIFAECGGKLLENAVVVVRQMVAEAGSLEPARLVPMLKRWQKDVYDGNDPNFYGEAVERVALFADFAVWIPWATSHAGAGSPQLPAVANPATIGKESNDHEQSLAN